MMDCFGNGTWKKPSLRMRIKWWFKDLWHSFFPRKYVFPIIKHTFPNLKASDIVSVQPLKADVSFKLDYVDSDGNKVVIK